jgi:hypothetical protein
MDALLTMGQCWINKEYSSLRLWLEEFWILFSIGLTIALYFLITVSLLRNRCARKPILTSRMKFRRTKDELPRPSGHHPAFFAYPVIYTICTAPLAIGRMLSIANGEPSLLYYGITGSFLAANGLLNVMLWSSTILLSSEKDIQETGLDRFSFMRTPRNRRFGNLVWVQGGIIDQSAKEAAAAHNDKHRWQLWTRGVLGEYGRHASTMSQESLQPVSQSHDEHIRMEVVTTVVVEAGSGKKSPGAVTRDVEKN